MKVKETNYNNPMKKALDKVKEKISKLVKINLMKLVHCKNYQRMRRTLKEMKHKKDQNAKEKDKKALVKVRKKVIQDQPQPISFLVHLS